MGFNNVSKIVLDFGDGTTGAVKTYTSPSIGTYTENYTYKKAGTYTITITAYNSSNGVELSTSSVMKINSCALRCNPHIRGLNK